MTDKLGELSAAGVSVWLDDLSRERIASGELDKLRQDKHVVGVTTNPTIFAAALSDRDDYAPILRDLALRGVSLDDAVREITTGDVRDACDVLRPVYDKDPGSGDGRVSIEVDPRLAYDTERTIAEAKALWWLVDRPNLYIKIPATKAGLPAIAAVLAEGISVNVTLIFGLERYEEVMNAFLDGMEAARDAGHDISTIASVASFFVSRVDTEIDKRLDAIGTPDALELRGKAAVANARLAYRRYEWIFDGVRWGEVANAGGRPQRPLWASTGTKNPAYSDVLYVEELVAPGVVNTMPSKTMDAFADHGTVDGDQITPEFDHAHEVLEQLAALGVDYDDVIATLESEGVEKFEASWLELLKSVETQLAGSAT